MANEKKYASLESLQTFKENIDNKFATKTSVDKKLDASKYVVDSQLSSTSSNPVQNKVIDAEFEAISTAMNALESEIDGKANTSHNHDDRYYTETEINTKLSGKSDTSHNHDSDYDSKGSANSALASAKSYADTAAANAANAVKNDLLNGAGTAYDTLKELGDLIVDNQDAIDALETVASGKADKTHSHEISDVSGLQSALDGKAASSHGTHVSFDSTNKPKMDGTSAFGTSSKVARADHVHPTDTSRASKTEFDTHVADTTKHITSTERTNWGAAYTHSQAAHAPSDAEKNQNAFSNIKVGDTTVAADTTTDTVTFVGSNVTITPDATNDKVTFSVADGSTSAKGVVKLTNSTSSTSTTTAATPNSVKSAYDLANTAKTNADSAYTLAESKVDSLSDLGITATATELNYVDGVTSNIQTQLDGKAASSHNQSASTITSGTLSSDRLPTIPATKGGTGQTSLVNSANALINALGAGDNVPTDTTCIITQGGSGYTDKFYRRPASLVWEYIKGKADSVYSKSEHTHNYAGSSSVGGAATTAVALTSKSIGSATNPVYFDANGKPVATTYTLGKSVPSDAKFTDTTYTFNGAVSTIKDSNLTANRALISNSSGKVAVSAVTSTELGYLDGVTSNIQTQINSISSEIGNISSLLDTINGEVV